MLPTHTANPAVIASGTFANKPSNPSPFQQYLVTDFGTGVFIYWTGAKWKPLGGEAVIYNSGVPTATTSSLTEVNLATITIPAGLVSATGGIEFYASFIGTATNGTKSPVVRHNTTSGATSGGTQLFLNAFTNTVLSGGALKLGLNNAATNAQIWNGGASHQGAATSSATAILGTIEYANASYFNFNALVANASDTIGWNQIKMKWVEN